MDPKQRILPQVAYEAIEDAGMRTGVEQLGMRTCRTGVFVGVMNLEYGALLPIKLPLNRPVYILWNHSIHSRQ